MSKTLLKNATLILEDASIKTRQNVYISEGKLEKIVCYDNDKDMNADEIIDCSSYFVSPGITNLHTHIAMNIFKGIAEDCTADAWFNDMIFPYESKMTDEDVYIGTKLGIAEMINNGVTAVADHYFGEEQVLRALKDTGIRGDIAPTLFGSAPNYKERLSEVTAFLKNHKNDSSRVALRVGPHADYTCPPDTLAEMAELADTLKLPVHMHYCDDRNQIALSKERYGKSISRIVKDSGLMKGKILFAHGLWTEEEMLDYITDDCYFAICPKTYLKMGLRKGSFFDYYKKLNFSFGTDGAASSNTLNPVEQSRLFAMICKFEDEPLECPVDYIWKKLMAGHNAFNFGTGHICEGAPADLVIWDLDTPDTMMTYSPITSIIYSSNSSNVRYTMVEGEFLKYDGKLKLNYKELANEAKEARDALLARGKGKASVSYLK